MGIFFSSTNPVSKQNCKSKIRFANDVAAQAALKKINPNKALKRPRRAYKCPHCGGWHLSSQPLK